MAPPQRVVQAVEAAIVASAHLAALQNVSAAAEACQRLGRLSSGRWRSAARDLAALEEDLQTGLESASKAVSTSARDLDVPEDALWAVGDAAGTFDMLRDAALDSVEDDDALVVRVLEGDALFGVSFLEDPELPDRGTTLLFGWPDPLAPATWPWQANWVVGDGQDSVSADGEDDDSDEPSEEDADEELDLFEAGELEGDELLVAQLAEELSCSRHDARAAVRSAAMALTKASLLAAAGGEDEEEEEEEEEE